MALVRALVGARMTASVHVNRSFLVEVLAPDHDDLFVFDEFYLHRGEVGIDDPSRRRLGHACELGVLFGVLAVGGLGELALLGQRKLTDHQLIEPAGVIVAEAQSIHDPSTLERRRADGGDGFRLMGTPSERLPDRRSAFPFDGLEQTVRPTVARRMHADFDLVAYREGVGRPSPARNRDRRSRLHGPLDPLTALVTGLDREVGVRITHAVLANRALEGHDRPHAQGGITVMTECVGGCRNRDPCRGCEVSHEGFPGLLRARLGWFVSRFYATYPANDSFA